MLHHLHQILGFPHLSNPTLTPAPSVCTIFHLKVWFLTTCFSLSSSKACSVGLSVSIVAVFNPWWWLLCIQRSGKAGETTTCRVETHCASSCCGWFFSCPLLNWSPRILNPRRARRATGMSRTWAIMCKRDSTHRGGAAHGCYSWLQWTGRIRPVCNLTRCLSLCTCVGCRD